MVVCVHWLLSCEYERRMLLSLAMMDFSSLMPQNYTSCRRPSEEESVKYMSVASWVSAHCYDLMIMYMCKYHDGDPSFTQKLKNWRIKSLT